MSVASICHRNVITIDPTASLAEAAKVMRERHVGFLVVPGGKFGHPNRQPIGVLTDRDIVIEVVAKKCDPDAVTVADAMSSPPLTIYEQSSIEDAVRLQSEHGVRRAPVVGADGELVGVVALDDMIGHIAGVLSLVFRTMRREQGIERMSRSA